MEIVIKDRHEASNKLKEKKLISNQNRWPSKFN